ncbi:helix-turn-helix domain-containing protein [Henriciella pelagia]|uniref:helix-turn-helix domain-containing protein n=1 Tax=Henriciella pelagia TaxID=1977912 RepID=UPI003517C58E
MDLRQRIRQRIDELGLSPRAVSLEAGLSSHFLQKFFINPDASIKVDNLLAIAKVLDCSPSWLLTGIDRENLTDPQLQILQLFDGELDKDAAQKVIEFARWQAEQSEKSG